MIKVVGLMIFILCCVAIVKWPVYVILCGLPVSLKNKWKTIRQKIIDRWGKTREQS